MNINTAPKEFVVTLTEHRVLGYVLAPYVIQVNDDGTFYSIISSVLKQNVDQVPDVYTEDQIHVVNLIDKYTEANLARRFSKRYGSKEFFDNMDVDYFNKHISPFIDKQIVACLEVIRESKIRLYYKPTKYSNVYDEDRIELTNSFAIPTFHFDLNEEGLKYYLTIEYEGHPLPLLFKKPVVITDFPCRMVMNNKLIAFRNIGSKRILPFLQKEYVKIPLNVTEKYLKTFVGGLLKEHRVVVSGFDIITVDSDMKAILSIEQDLMAGHMLVLSYQYGTKRFRSGQKGNVEVELKNNQGRYQFYKHIRDIRWEAQILQFFIDNELIHSGDQLLLSQKANPFNDEHTYGFINWVNEHRDDLKRMGIDVEQRGGDQKFYTGNQELDINMKMEGDWFDLYAVVKFGDFHIPFIRLRKNILNGIREFVLPNGEIVILPFEWFAKYKDLFPYAQGKGETIRFSKHHFSLLKEQLQGIDEDIVCSMKELETHSFKIFDVPKGVNAQLRTYQQEGFSWMYALTKNNFGGCLADDMGLGKTLQTLTLLLEDKKHKTDDLTSDLSEYGAELQLFDRVKNNKKASLIVVPTSLIHNWQNEVKKFVPQLKLYKHVGAQRKRIANIRGVIDYYDIVITTYGTIRNDYKLFDDVKFNYLILDESQYIKNARSKTYQAVCALHSDHKLVLTGTPIENSLSDLWSQINFLNRGLLGSLSFFKKEFVYPIEKMNDEDKNRKLLQLIAPFILRRTKNEVAKDLPALTEQICYCDMTEEQSKIYEEQKSVIRNSLFENIQKLGGQKTSFLALQGLTRLRQLANHPLLFDSSVNESGKFNAVMQHMENLMAENHKVLIFSSFVSHLKIYQAEFDKLNYKYCLLTGQTRDRETVIKDFQENENKRIFLISLKAGGVGLNLTSADYIFILDPWWNPAAENQAINRAHRIGQNKKVFVYRFITENTIEEKIQHLKERKTILADRFVQSNNPFHSSSNEEILNLFS